MFKDKVTGTLSVVSIVCFCIALFFVWKTLDFVNHSQKVRGTVVDEFIQPPSTSYPIVQFTTLKGEVITYKSTVSSDPPEHSIGDTVDIYYNPSDANDIMISSFFTLWFLPIFFGLFG